MLTQRKQKNYSVNYQITDITLEVNQSMIDGAFDILFDSILEGEEEGKKLVDTSRQEGVYCQYGISNKERGSKIFSSSHEDN